MLYKGLTSRIGLNFPTTSRNWYVPIRIMSKSPVRTINYETLEVLSDRKGCKSPRIVLQKAIHEYKQQRQGMPQFFSPKRNFDQQKYIQIQNRINQYFKRGKKKCMNRTLNDDFSKMFTFKPRIATSKTGRRLLQKRLNTAKTSERRRRIKPNISTGVFTPKDIKKNINQINQRVSSPQAKERLRPRQKVSETTVRMKSEERPRDSSIKYFKRLSSFGRNTFITDVRKHSLTVQRQATRCSNKHTPSRSPYELHSISDKDSENSSSDSRSFKSKENIEKSEGYIKSAEIVQKPELSKMSEKSIEFNSLLTHRPSLHIWLRNKKEAETLDTQKDQMKSLSGSLQGRRVKVIKKIIKKQTNTTFSSGSLSERSRL